MSDETTIQPALTSGEWKARQATRETDEANYTRFGFTGMNAEALCIISRGGSGATDNPAALHGIAAFALYGQPFGFTQEDLGAIEESRHRAVEAAKSLAGMFGPAFKASVEHTARAERLRLLGVKLAALLPKP